MKSGSLRTLIPCVCFALGVYLTQLCQAERGFVLVQVQDTKNHPLRGVEVGIDGFGGSNMTGNDGKAKLSLGSAAKEGDWISLSILHSPPGKDWVMLSPWDNRSQVPSFEDKPDNFIRIVVVQRGDRAVLESGPGVTSLTETITKANAAKTVGHEVASENPKENLEIVAKQYGLSADEVDRAIRAWGAKTNDHFEAGLVALYERDFAKASALLQDSLKQREEKLTTDQKTADLKTVAQDRDQVAVAAFFLGQALFELGKYGESSDAYQKCLDKWPHDPRVLNRIAMDLSMTGDLDKAEKLYTEALALDRASVPTQFEVAAVLGNFAILLTNEGQYERAEPMLREALAIDERVLGAGRPEVATALNNLGTFLMKEGKLTEAAGKLNSALEIDEAALEPGDTRVAADMSNLGLVYSNQDDDVNDAKAESLFTQAYEIDKAASGPNNPDVAVDLNNLGTLLEKAGNSKGAEEKFREALHIEEQVGLETPTLVTTLGNLGNTLLDQHRDAEAEVCLDRARNIAEKLIPESLDFAMILNASAFLPQSRHDYPAAELLFRRALSVGENALGRGTPGVAQYMNNLGTVLCREGKFDESISMISGALEIYRKTLGPTDQRTRQTESSLNNCLDSKRQQEK
jgi:tetratricopeptide (TPR) repeat protein